MNYKLKPVPRDTLWDYKECARYLDIAEVTLRKKVASGEIPHIKLGEAKTSPIRFFPVEIKRWLLSQRTGKRETLNNTSRGIE